jgi:hypothetical protein
VILRHAASRFSDAPAPGLEGIVACGKCGGKRVDVRPNWKEQRCSRAMAVNRPNWFCLHTSFTLGSCENEQQDAPKFMLGQAVKYHALRGLYTPPGIYLVTAKLPERDGEFE